jgi:hypothetical protein
MRHGKMIRLLVVMLTLAAAIGGSFWPLAWGQSRPPSAQLPQFGEADGFACVLFYGSDIDGSLEPCG